MANILDLKDPETQNPQETDGEAVGSEEEFQGEPASDDAFGLGDDDTFDDVDDEGLYPRKVSWKASTRPDELERRKEHIMMAFLAGITGVTAFWLGSMPLVLIASLTIVAWEVHHRTHEETDVHIDAEGIRLNGHRHPFAKLESFSIQRMPDESWHLSVRHASRFIPDIRVPMGAHDHEGVKALLANHIAEDEHPLPASELFLKS